MNTSCKIGFSVAASMIGVAANVSAADDVSAADIAKGTYDVTGIVTAAASANCTLAGLKKGSAATSTIIYPGAGQPKLTLASPYTLPTGKPGSAATYVCIAVGKVPATGLNGANITYNCYNDTVKGPAKAITAQIKAKYTVGASHSPAVSQVTTNASIIVGGKNFCTYTTDSSYILK